jgi:hypothetical protein
MYVNATSLPPNFLGTERSKVGRSHRGAVEGYKVQAQPGRDKRAAEAFFALESRQAYAPVLER